jgi:hypothetical protein
MRFGSANIESASRGQDHLFEIGSISKSFTALCIFQLMRRKLGSATISEPMYRTRLRARRSVQHLSLIRLPDDAPIFPRRRPESLAQPHRRPLVLIEPGLRCCIS